MNSRQKFLSFNAEVGIATNEDARRLCFGDSEYGDKSARRLTGGLVKEGLLVSSEKKIGVGRSPKVFAINKDRKREVKDITGKDSVRVIDPKSSFHIRHQLCLNSVLVSFLVCCEGSKDYKCEFITDLEGEARKRSVHKVISEKEYLPHWGKVVFVPDAVICVTNTKQYRKALMFIEMDRETTTLKKIGGRGKNVETKIKAYCSMWESQNFRKYDEVFDYRFDGFRLLWIALTQRRVQAVSRLCDREGLGDSAWLSTLEEIEAKGVFRKVWTVPGSKGVRSLVKENKS